MNLSQNRKWKLIKFFKDYQQKFFLYDWDIEYRWNQAEDDYCMKTESDDTYLQAIVTIYEKKMLRRWEERGDNYIRTLCAHELLHILISPVANLTREKLASEKQLEDEEERLIERLTKIVFPRDWWEWQEPYYNSFPESK